MPLDVVAVPLGWLLKKSSWSPAASGMSAFHLGGQQPPWFLSTCTAVHFPGIARVLPGLLSTHLKHHGRLPVVDGQQGLA